MASLDDILTTSKNIVTAINNVAQTYLNVQGVRANSNITTTALIKTGAGRVANIVVVTAGSGAGVVYDANKTTSTTNPIYTIPTTAGVYVVNMPVSNGIVIVPGTGQQLAISYS